jgi:hypothetical protein
MKLEIFATDFRKKNPPQVSTFMEILLVGTEFFHADGYTDRLDEAFRNFEQTPKKIT